MKITIILLVLCHTRDTETTMPLITIPDTIQYNIVLKKSHKKWNSILE